MVNKITSNLPYIIVLWWVFLLSIMYTDYYYYNWKTLDEFDKPLIAISLIHFLFKSKYYSIKKLIFVVCILFTLLLRKAYFSISENTYYILYYSNLIITLFAPLFIKNARKRKGNQGNKIYS